MTRRVSKNQRTATPTSSKTMQLVGDVRLITPLNQGKHARVYNVVTGTNPHVATDSEAFDAHIADLVSAGHAGRVNAELTKLAAEHPGDGWDRIALRVAPILNLQPADA